MTDYDNMQNLSAEEKKILLYERQKNLLNTFLEHGTITKEQYNKSLTDLTLKMGFADNGKK